MPKIKYKKKQAPPVPAPEAKEYIINCYKIIDDGYEISIYIKVKDGFQNEYFKHYGSFQHTAKPATGKKVNHNQLFGYQDHIIHDMGVILKHLLEENAHLKFYNKLEKALK